LIVAVLGLVAAETALAGRLARRGRGSNEPAGSLTEVTA
jgi:hypothetical protein